MGSSPLHMAFKGQLHLSASVLLAKPSLRMCSSNSRVTWLPCRYPVTCNVGSSKLHYSVFAGVNPYWMMFSISNTRYKLWPALSQHPSAIHSGLNGLLVLLKGNGRLLLRNLLFSGLHDKSPFVLPWNIANFNPSQWQVGYCLEP